MGTRSVSAPRTAYERTLIEPDVCTPLRGRPGALTTPSGAVALVSPVTPAAPARASLEA